jgi:glyoxylase-like metal-dependent hydrolase (beta-lactamase superfamily II)
MLREYFFFYHHSHARSIEADMRILKFFLLAVYGVFPSVLFGEAPTKHDFEMVKVAEGIYGFIANESNSGAVQGNVVLIVGEKSALLIDSGQFPTLAERMAAKAREVTDKPVRLLINTHWHGDHLLANHIFREKFPGLLVLAHQNAKEPMLKYYAKWDEEVKSFPTIVEQMRTQLKSGKRRSGAPLDDEQKLGLQMDIDSLEVNYPEMIRTKFEAPDMYFTKEISFDVGNREVKVANYGWGNTAGDAVIHVPDVKVLITGDTVVYPTPYSFGSNHSEWIKILNQFLSIGAEKIIPGHGPVMTDTSYIKTLISLLEDTRTQVRAAVKEGLKLEDVRKRVTLEDWKTKLAGNDKFRRRAFRDFYLNPGIEQAYKEAVGEPLTE